MPLRPMCVSPPLIIYEIKLDRAAIDQMPPDARRNLFLFGHIANEINTGYRLLNFSIQSEQTGDRIIDMYADARAFTALRFLIGTMREGYRAVEQSILKGPFGRDYLPDLTPEGTEILNAVKAHLGKMQLISGLRNGYSFHFPDHAQLDHAYGKLPIDVDVAAYSGQHRHSSLYEMSHRLILCGMFELVPEADSMPDRAVMDVIFEDVLDKTVVLSHFIESIIVVLVERHNLSPAPMIEVATIDTHDTVNTFKIPPLLRS
jgi:hypothetical protein